MTYFPHSFAPRPASTAVKSLVPVRQTLTRDILWGRPVFKAPALPNPRIVFDPLPFTATRPARITRRG
ncbi:MAG: hypothetical protein ACOZE5_15360 [Verrucomicrobiota bacterium]